MSVATARWCTKPCGRRRSVSCRGTTTHAALLDLDDADRRKTGRWARGRTSGRVSAWCSRLHLIPDPARAGIHRSTPRRAYFPTHARALAAALEDDMGATFRMPDVGGVTEAEVVEWQAAVGRSARRDAVLGNDRQGRGGAAVTGHRHGRRAGRADRRHGCGRRRAAASPAPARPRRRWRPNRRRRNTARNWPSGPNLRRSPRPRPPRRLARRTTQRCRAAAAGTPAVRRRALELGIDLQVTAAARTGESCTPISTVLATGTRAVAAGVSEVERIKVVGLRRALPSRRSRHARFRNTYVDEVDVSEPSGRAGI